MAQHWLLLTLTFFTATLGFTSAPANANPCPLSFPKAGLCATIQWDSQPTASRPNAFTLKFWDAQNSSEAGPYRAPSSEPFVKLWMPSMGHGSRPVTFLPAKDAAGNPIAGVYRVEKVVFTMRGDWDIQVQLRSNNQVLEQAVLSLFL